EAVEDLVQTVIDTLTATGQLDNTYVVFTSDNGFHQGQHRLKSGKNTAYDTDLFVPLVIRGPGIMPGTSVDEATLNVDFAPTFLDLAGVAIPDSVDGRSLVPLFNVLPPPSWRQQVFLEHADEVDGDDLSLVTRLAIAGTLEPGDFVEGAADKEAEKYG